ncbi:MAG: HIT family protein [Chloroflexota bacterium]
MNTASHEPTGYHCPFCTIVAGHDQPDDFTKQEDVVYRDEAVTAFIAAKWWPGNPGHVLVVPNGHHENVYEMPDDALAAVQVAGKQIALAIRATYGCEGTSFRQHNEPAGNQDVWHYHLHVFPRYHGDDLYLQSGKARFTSPGERAPYAEKLRRALRQPAAGD